MKKQTLSMLAFGFVLVGGTLLVDVVSDGTFLINHAEARVGRPLTPVSYAGVARRTTRRTVTATTVYVASLPQSCTTVVIEGATLHQCGTTYYQASGSQYVVVKVN